MKTVALLTFCIYLITGCKTTETLPSDARWGKGVADPAGVAEQLERLANAEAMADRNPALRDAYVALSWTQAARVYRNASLAVKGYMVHDLIPYQDDRFNRMTRDQVISTLGKPDGIHGDELVYTGEGYASDSTSGYLFYFAQDGTFDYIGYAN